MNYFTITNSFIFPSLMFFIAISMAQPTLKRKIAAMCICPALLSLLFVYTACMERHELPPVLFWLNIAMAMFFLLSPILVYRQTTIWQRKIEAVKQRSAKRAAYIKSLRYKEDED